jgi:hypothetical protein
VPDDHSYRSSLATNNRLCLSTQRVEAVRDKALHTEVVHVAERHRLAGLFVFEIGTQLFVGAFS